MVHGTLSSPDEDHLEDVMSRGFPPLHILEEIGIVVLSVSGVKHVPI